MNKIFDERKISTFRDFKDLVRSNKLIGRREICIVVDRLELENVVYKAEEYDTITKEKDKEIERLNNIINEYEKIMKECSDRILKELNENNHLSYGPALSINYRLTNYKELKEGK